MDYEWSYLIYKIFCICKLSSDNLRIVDLLSSLEFKIKV